MSSFNTFYFLSKPFNLRAKFLLIFPLLVQSQKVSWKINKIKV